MPLLPVADAMLREDSTARGAPPCSLAAAQAYCERFTRQHYENFTVASRLLPGELLPHFHAVYAYCRAADDLADETGDPAESLRLLDQWEQLLERCYRGDAEHPIFVALQETIRQFAIPAQPFHDLISAFRQDQHITRYPTTEALLDYCRRSANPVGRLILYIGRCHDEQSGTLADSICTGLQWINFCQDVARDYDRGRIYLPAESFAAAGYDEAMFAQRLENDAFRRALAQEVARAEAFLHGGQSLVELVPTGLRIDVSLFAAGGLAIARAIRRQQFNVWRHRPTLSKWTQASLLLRCWWQVRRMPASPRSKEAAL